jgi:flagellar protein FliL
MAAPSSAPAAAAATAAPVAKASARKKPWLLIGTAGAVLLACGGTGAWLLMAHNAPKKTTAAAPPAPPSGPPLYVALDPPFVSNFEGDQQVRFLQVTAQIMTHDPKTVEALKAEDPIIRNDLLLLFSNQKATRGGSDCRAQGPGGERRQAREGRCRALHQLRDAVTVKGLQTWGCNRDRRRRRKNPQPGRG